MGGLFGGGGNGANSEARAMQQEAAADTRAKEEARAARLAQGKTAIDQLFEGAPVMGARQVQKTRKVAKPVASGSPSPNQQFSPTYDASGRGSDHMTPAYSPGDFVAPTTAAAAPEFVDENYQDTEQYDTGQRSGGIGDEFYNKYRKAMLDYYEPEVGKQYDEALKQTRYGFARSGTGQSGARVGEEGKLKTDYDLNLGVVRSKADTATAGLKQRVGQEKQSLLNQLYATEDPEMAASQALSKVRTTMSETPELNPLGDVFKIAAIGGGNFAQNYFNPYNRVTQPKTNAFTVPS